MSSATPEKRLVPPGTGRFVADAMLGRLAKWLRLLGQDVLYPKRVDDAALLRICKDDPSRILLTRDQQLILRRPIARGEIIAILLSRNDLMGQLREVKRRVGLLPGPPRCAVCNGVLCEEDKATVEKRVPPYVFATQASFRRCTGCGRLYWRATHWNQIREALRTVRDEATDP